MSKMIEHDMIGRTVQCKPVGCVPEFIGVVETAWRGEFNHRPITYFHIRNLADGTIWHRDLAEVSEVLNDANAPIREEA